MDVGDLGTWIVTTDFEKLPKVQKSPNLVTLTMTFNFSGTFQFEAWKRADIYSLSLVFWEFGRRCSVGGVFEDFELPFYEMVPDDPTIEDMKTTVCERQLRPSCPTRWQDSDVRRHITSIFQNCFSLFSSFQYRWQTVNNIDIKFADDWIRTADLWHWKRLLCQLSHNHCPKLLHYQRFWKCH